jgi:hypothetical protein
MTVKMTQESVKLTLKSVKVTQESGFLTIRYFYKNR